MAKVIAGVVDTEFLGDSGTKVFSEKVIGVPAGGEGLALRAEPFGGALEDALGTDLIP